MRKVSAGLACPRLFRDMAFSALDSAGPLPQAAKSRPIPVKGGWGWREGGDNRVSPVLPMGREPSWVRGTLT